ncbi:hypothetical protein IBG28_03610 [Marinomonas arctica]|uniref:KAP NTPase domain-containing protein n=3 Tax=Marinomonas arctica TaxID=383750 RepID=A0A7H1J8D1_9GAMM|nr:MULTISPECIES: P-loop NTPase fold protein [Marinomonas]QNT06747.1 hypothetical protein IBG28_03610 [Marinomonas arctica]
MQRNPPFTPEYRSELRARLERLDQNVVVALSIRCALRVFPLLTYTENRKHFFNYWPEHRSKHILAIWRVLLSYNNNRENLSLIKKAAEATQKAHPIIESTIESVLFIAESNPYYSIYHAYSAAYSASPLSTDHVTFQAVPFPDIKAELELDLAILEAGEVITLTGLPLWQKPNSDYINWLEKHLPDALNQLSSEQDKRLTSSTLNNIWPIYKGIFDGKPDKKAIDNALNQLEEYFSNKGIDETENNKLFYGKDDEPFYGKDDELFYKRKNEPNSETEPEETKYGIETIAGNRHSSHQYAAEDKLNRQHLVNTLATLLQDQNNHHHQTIGLLGHWGVGKTSFVELLRTALKTKKQKGEPDFLFAEFNAWEYEHTDNLQAGIAQEMIKALSSPEPKPVYWEKASWPLRKVLLTARFALSLHGFKVLIPLSLFAASLAPLWVPDSLKGAFTSLVQPLGNGVASILPYAWVGAFLIPTFKKTKEVFAGPLAKELLTYLKLPDYGKHLGTIPVMREHIKKLTKVRLGNEKRLLYVVDDLDRCGHKGIVKVLEAVRMVLDLDNVIVVIAVDQRIALAALALNYKELATQHHIEDPRLIARDYLAKIIHLPIVLTEPDEASVASYLANLWDETSSPESKALAKKAGTLLQEDSSFIKNNTNNTDEANQTDGIGQEAKTKKKETSLDRILKKPTQKRRKQTLPLKKTKQ